MYKQFTEREVINIHVKNAQLHLKLKKCDFKQDNLIFHLLEWQKV